MVFQFVHHKIVGRARFALAKSPKRHIKHELDAHLSTSTHKGQFSSGIYQKVVFQLVHHKIVAAVGFEPTQAINVSRL